MRPPGNLGKFLRSHGMLAGIAVAVGVATFFSSGYLTSIDTTPSGYLTGLVAGVVSTPNDSLIRVNLHTGSITLFENGTAIRQSTIAAAGNPNDQTATPTGSFKVLSKERMHKSRLSGVWMPYSMRFFEGYYFHAIPLTPDGNLITTRYSHGCIRLPDGLIEDVYGWARIGTRVEIYRATLVKAADAPEVYALSPAGVRSHIKTEQAFTRRGYRWQDVATVPAAELALMPLGETMW